MQTTPSIPEVITIAQMRAAEQAAMARGVPGLRLMAAAGRAVADAVIGRKPAPARVAVLCGPGNNGGDGYVVARHLADRGYAVSLYGLVQPAALAGDARTMADLWDGPVLPPGAFRAGAADIIVCALFGTGLARPVEGAAAALIRAANEGDGVLRVAVDIPSGIAGDTGAVMGVAFHADLTVTFHAKKPGHLLYPGRRHSGAVIVADIGLGAGATEEGRREAGGPEIVVNDASRLIARLGPAVEGHKYSRGHALVLAGGLEGCGAARLAGRAALRTGAGLVTLGVPGSALLAHASRGPDALMLRKADGADGLAELLADKRRNAVVIGPAYGVGVATRAAVATVLASGRVAVLDADALTSFSGEAEALAALTNGSGRAILTPHDGEFARIDPLKPEQPPERDRADPSKTGSTGNSRLFRALSAAAFYGAVVVLKGPDTVIAAPDGRAAINTNAPPWLGTAGSGDVLAGLIAGLAAQGLSPFDAACAGVWLHGEAGKSAGRGLIADDLPEAVRQVLANGQSPIAYRD